MATLRGLQATGAAIDTLSTTTITLHTIDASNDSLAFVSLAEEAATITHLGFRQGTLTGTSPTFKIGFQGLTTGGVPDGAYKGGASPASATFTVSGANDGTFVWVALDNTYDVARGEQVCVVVEYSSGTIDASNKCSFTRMLGGEASLYGIPYHLTETAGSWTKQDDKPVWGMKSSTTSYGNPISGLTSHVGDSADSPDEFGAAFTIPVDIADSYKISGVILLALDVNNQGASDVVTVTLYNDTTALVSNSFTGDVFGSNQLEQVMSLFTSESAALSPGTEYIVAVKTSSATVVVTLLSRDYLSAQDAASPLSVGYVSRTDSGAWSAADYTAVPPIALIFSDITEPAGGILIHPGMSGGMRG